MKNNTLIFLFGIALFLCSCRANYIPPPLNNPMLSRANETNLNANFAFGDITTTGNVNVGYSPINNLGFVYSFSGYSAQREYTNSTTMQTFREDYYRGVYNELMGGYYKGFSKHGLLELYLGLGLGNSKNHYFQDNPQGGSFDGYSKLGYTRTSIMPAVGFKSKNFQFSYGIKAYQVNFYKNDRHGIFVYDYMDEIDRLSKSNYYFIDHGVTMKFGHRNVQLMAQLSNTRKLSNNIISYEAVRFGLGIQIQFFANY